MFQIRALLSALTLAASGGQTSRDLSYLDKLNEADRLSPSEVARLENALLTTPHDLSVRARLIVQYWQTQEAHPRLRHVIWVIENHPESKLAGSPPAAIDAETGSRAEYEAVKWAWERSIESNARSAPVLGNAALFLAAEEPRRAEDLFRKAWDLEPDNAFRKASIRRFRIRVLQLCDERSNQASCPDPVWLSDLAARLRQ